MAGEGRVEMLAWIHQGSPPPGVELPYGFAIVGLFEQPGVRFSGPLVNCARENGRIGMHVHLCWGERDGAPYPQFEPISPK